MGGGAEFVFLRSIRQRYRISAQCLSGKTLHLGICLVSSDHGRIPTNRGQRGISSQLGVELIIASNFRKRSLCFGLERQTA